MGSINLRVWAVVVGLALTGLVGCETEAKNDCERLGTCVCGLRDLPLYPAEIRAILCRTWDADAACPAGTSPEDCQLICRTAYSTYVAEGGCGPVSESGTVTPGTTTGRQAIEVARPAAQEWDAGAYPTAMQCLNLDRDGGCGGWWIDWASDGATGGFRVHAIGGLAPFGDEVRMSYDRLPDGWLDLDEVAAAAWARAPARVDIAQTILMSVPSLQWTVIFCWMEGTTRNCGASVSIDALTGTVVE